MFNKETRTFVNYRYNPSDTNSLSWNIVFSLIGGDGNDLWIGFGQAGGKIANTMMEANRKLYSAIAINTEQADLVGLNNIREKVLIGKYALKGRGVGADIELAANITEKALSQFDLVLFGKGAEYFLDEAKIELLHRFVRDRGGGLLFCRGKPYYQSLDALALLEPVEWGPALRSGMRWRPTLTATVG